jgi:hypothetical protein
MKKGGKQNGVEKHRWGGQGWNQAAAPNVYL